jgi:ATP-dependent exoDNAse (exonuclease V) beta subunit
MIFNTIGTAQFLPEIVSTDLDGVRHYVTPNGDKYPSITTVLSLQSKEGIERWKKRIGKEEAEKQSYRAATRGTYMHEMIEYYLKNDYDPSKYKDQPLAQMLFGVCKNTLNRINNIHIQEAPLYSDKLKIAGRVDCIAEFDGVLSIIDFKTSKKEKEERYISNYFVQESAYAAMYYERTGTPVKQLVTIISCEDGSCQVFVKRDIMKYIRLLKQYIDEYNEWMNRKMN